MTSLAGFAHRLVAPILAGGRWYSRTAEKWPFSMGVLTTGLKTSAADIFAQTVVERREDIDWKRHAMFCLFGFGYLGAWQYYLYNNVFVRLCGPITKSLGHVGVSPVKTFLDQGLHHPFMYFPAFYALKGGLENRPLQDSYTAYRADLWENCKALWSVWVPAQLVNFAIVPRHLRIPYVAGVSFVWTVILSCMRGSMEPEAAPPTAPEKHEAQV